MDKEKILPDNLKTNSSEESKKMDIDNEIKDDDLDNDPKSSKHLKRGRIFVRNLPFSITEEKLRGLFSKFGEIKELTLPYDQTKKMFKGFAFLQYETKKEALIAIKELNAKIFDRRKLDITIAQPKNEYNGLPKIEQDEKRFKKNTKEEDSGKIRSYSLNSKEAKNLEKHEKNAAQSENDPSRTLFIRNLGFNTNEDVLDKLFSKYGKLKYCLICRNKETNASKGSGFVMFEQKDDIDNVLNIYEKYESNKEYSGLNPFELEGRNLKLFRALTKEDAVKSKEEKKNENSGDNRNRELLYYGLNNYYDFISKEIEVSEEDKVKRENIIQLKKTNFKKNPNLHVSETRLVLRNMDKTYDEKQIKELLRQQAEKFMEEMKGKSSGEFKIYCKLKKIKQIKLMRDEKILDKENNPKSKSVAFVEVCDKNFGKWLINNISNMIVSKNKKKGLIMDFALDDIRKIRNRLIKIDKIKMKNKPDNENEKSKTKNKDKKAKKESENTLELNENEKRDNSKKEEKNKNVESIDTITDIEKLAEIYNKSISRGKRQRIKKRVKALGHPVSVLGKSKELNFSQVNKNLIVNKNSFFNKSDSNEEKDTNKEKDFLQNLKKGISDKNSYTVVRVDKDNMNINKKIKEEIKKGKSKNKNENEDNKLTGKKRGREFERNKPNKDNRNNSKSFSN